MVWVAVGITGSALGLKIYAITIGIKMYKSVIKEKKKKHDEIVMLEKTTLKTIETIEILIFKASIDLYISHNEFVSVMC